jgi:hypothetical protein
MSEQKKLKCKTRTIKNFAPNMDCIIISVGEWKITVERDLDNEIYIAVEDTVEGSETRMILGQEGETQKL